MKRICTLLFFCFLFLQTGWMQESAAILYGHVTGKAGQKLAGANVVLAETDLGTFTDASGIFSIGPIPPGTYNVHISTVGYHTRIEKVTLHVGQRTELNIELEPSSLDLTEVEVFGKPNKQVEKLQTITRLPLEPSDQIQSISVISDRLIELQGNLTISEAARNVPGIYTFATYGNQRESMSARGYRGIPLLKNGVRVNSDFRGIGILSDMQGVESIQVLKGASAITQGIATDLGSPGGVINLVTKVPRFYNTASVSLRVGSWGQIRPTFDVQGLLNQSQTLAFRLNGAYEHANSYRTGVSLEKFYINPSLAWKPDPRTTVTLEMDFLDDSRTPDPGTVNLAANDTNAIYDLPYDRFLGFSSNRAVTRNGTYTARIQRELNDQLQLRAAYIYSGLDISSITTSLSSGGRGLPNLSEFNQRYRTIGASSRIDKNSVLQLDLIAQEVKTGAVKHTLQVGVDYRTNFLETSSSSQAGLHYVDIIDVFQPVPNDLPETGQVYVAPVRDEYGNVISGGQSEAAAIELLAGDPVRSRSRSYGLMLQDVVELTNWASVFLGIRYNSQESTGSATETEISRGNAWNPQLGLMVRVKEGLNVFGSYTSSTSLRGAGNVDINGVELGNQRIDQLEAGIKSDWYDNRLRFNLTLYKINNTNMPLPVYDANWNPTGYYQKGGNDERKGIEVELIGRILPELEIVGGYAYIDARYKEHTSFYRDSAPLNTPKHTANAWLNYTVGKGKFSGLNLGAGAYYIGERPVNDWATTVTHEGIVPDQEPFNIESYTVVNAYLGYRVSNYGFRLLFNNIFDQIGYNAYRTRFINQTDPRSFAAVISYDFR
ncbi:TonB-dependent receptor [Flavilitoribacter nigricans]|uniref:TonB-dependent siderophore receptor n=1 Tax=Flavilitoribacter nigricans (strain ATCC 23147 / DSM 23189 / NBRC 102662 / NCIMB 1420 / SS-2) TaxID=1122177 RepID=A0A2D0NEE5_FLAN2|nr:TonB-dependent receptor [Flavilitoribacter nigricans]PHN06862.1 TonB-dependent siderophore receptor [Flavilitoribacter nigricans DSM 23189 = NBRC 102662]